MAAATAAQHLGMSASSVRRPSPLATRQKPTSTSTNPVPAVVCQQPSNPEDRSINSNISRRLFAVAGASATAVGAFAFAQPQAADAKRSKPQAPAPAEETKEEDKSLSAYDARLLATAKRKEALKASLDKLKAKAT